MKILETERLLLRGLEQGDFKDVCKLLQDDEVMYAYEGAFNDQEVQNWIGEFVSKICNYSIGRALS